MTASGVRGPVTSVSAVLEERALISYLGVTPTSGVLRAERDRLANLMSEWGMKPGDCVEFAVESGISLWVDEGKDLDFQRVADGTVATGDVLLASLVVRGRAREVLRAQLGRTCLSDEDCAAAGRVYGRPEFRGGPFPRVAMEAPGVEVFGALRAGSMDLGAIPLVSRVLALAGELRALRARVWVLMEELGIEPGECVDMARSRGDEGFLVDVGRYESARVAVVALDEVEEVSVVVSGVALGELRRLAIASDLSVEVLSERGEDEGIVWSDILSGRASGENAWLIFCAWKKVDREGRTENAERRMRNRE